MFQRLIAVGSTVASPILTASAEGTVAIIQADPANTATVFLGNPGVIAAGVGLAPGQAQSLALDGGSDLWGISTAPGQLVKVLSGPGLSQVGPLGRSQVEGIGTAGAPAGGVMTVQGPTGSGGASAYPRYTINNIAGSAIPMWLVNAALMALTAGNDVNGTLEPLRTPAIFKSLSAVLIAAETTIWAPAAGKKFRLMGYAIAQGGATGAITLRDNTGGATILVIPQNTVGVVQTSPPLGNGIVSAAMNNPLTATGVATETMTGYVFGTEE